MLSYGQVILPYILKTMNIMNFNFIFSSPEQSSRRAVVLPPASALALALASASTNVEVLR